MYHLIVTTLILFNIFFSFKYHFLFVYMVIGTHAWPPPGGYESFRSCGQVRQIRHRKGQWGPKLLGQQMEAIGSKDTQSGPGPSTNVPQSKSNGCVTVEATHTQFTVQELKAWQRTAEFMVMPSRRMYEYDERGPICRKKAVSRTYV